MDVLNMIAYQKGVNYESVAKTIVACGGPVNKGTKVRRTSPLYIMAILGTTKAPLDSKPEGRNCGRINQRLIYRMAD